LSERDPLPVVVPGEGAELLGQPGAIDDVLVGEKPGRGVSEILVAEVDPRRVDERHRVAGSKGSAFDAARQRP
jgi:hypothetical protein